ncbi:hypothetical protein HPK22_01510 [Helicobacter pylori]|nr:hypothetical protein HPK22_01510 [Helicobacter pylori]
MNLMGSKRKRSYTLTHNFLLKKCFVALELSEKNEEFSSFLKSVVDYDPKNQNRYKDEFDGIKKKEELYPNS